MALSMAWTLYSVENNSKTPWLAELIEKRIELII